MGGRPRKPTALHVIDGTARPDRMNPDEPHPDPKLPTAPRFLLPEAKREWRRAGKLLEELGVITEIDRSALAQYCQAWARWVEAEERLTEYGDSASARRSAKTFELLTTATAKLGMTPVDRAKVRGVKKGEQDPLGSLLGETG